MNEYRKLLDDTWNSGMFVAPRSISTVERVNVSLTFDGLTQYIRPSFNWQLAAVEAAGMIAGGIDRSYIAAVAPSVAGYFVDDNVDYGPRINIQRVVDTLRDDPLSRRAVAIIGDNADKPSEQRCPQFAQWLLRDNVLHCIVTFRSQDVVRGLPYDMYMWNVVTQVIQRSTGAVLRKLTINAGSSHLYLADRKLVNGSDVGRGPTIVDAGSVNEYRTLAQKALRQRNLRLLFAIIGQTADGATVVLPSDNRP